MSYNADYRRKRYANDPEFRDRLLVAGRAYRKRNKKKINAKARWRHATDPDYRNRKRDSRLKATYGLTLQEYDALVAKQKGRCAFCKRKPRGGLHVDHCHRRKIVRWLLCGPCNRGIGIFNDDPRLLRTAANGLSRFRKTRRRSPTKAAPKKRR